ncbi:SiaB family protein kinase [Marinilabiliaceae bacterium ANBcel2]|nr:SiaB family protein kinase [Marinilabiliaceae bacterium ANBcel2]
MGFDLDKWVLHKMQGEVLLHYVGEITSDKITEALTKIESNLNIKNEKNIIRKKVFNVFVECIQNLFHHVDESPKASDIENKGKFGIIILAKDNSFYRISTGNFVRIDKINIIKDRVDQVNSLSDEEIKSVYRDILGNEDITIKGGGGLGMLDIVRKTGNKLEYSVYTYNKELVFFALDVYIS